MMKKTLIGGFLALVGVIIDSSLLLIAELSGKGDLEFLSDFFTSIGQIGYDELITFIDVLVLLTGTTLLVMGIVILIREYIKESRKDKEAIKPKQTISDKDMK